MKRLWIIVFLLLLPVAHGLLQPRSAETATEDVLLTGASNLANMKLSLANSYAFFDPGSGNSTIITPFIGERIRICNTSALANCVEGVIGTAGSGEALGDEKLPGSWSNGANPFETLTTSGNDITSALNTTHVGFAYQSISATTGELLKVSYLLTVNSGGPLSYVYTSSAAAGTGDYKDTVFATTPGSTTSYRTTRYSQSFFSVYASIGVLIDFAFESATLKQVTAPSATGFWIRQYPTSADGNAWSKKGASFDPNQASGFTWTILRSKPVGKIATTTGSATLANSKLSLVDGTAFFDFGVDLTAHVGKTIRIYDSSKNVIVGVVGAVGTGETLGSDLLSGFDFTSGWITSSASVVDSNSFTVTAPSGYVGKTATFNPGGLLKGSFDITATSGTCRLTDGTLTNILFTDGEADAYSTVAMNSASIILYGGTNGATIDVGTMVVQAVTAPSSTGHWIYSAGGTTTKNWTSKSASFNPNDASGYTYSIEAQAAVASTAVHVATVAGGAMAWIDGVDLSPYAGEDITQLGMKGLYISAVNGTAFLDGNGTAADLSSYVDKFIQVCDTSSRCIGGWGKAAGDGEDLGGELITDTGFDNTDAWAKVNWTVSGSKANAVGLETANAVVTVTNVTTPAAGLFKIVYDVENYSSGSVASRIAYVASGTSRTANGTYSDYINLSGGSTRAVGVTTASSSTSLKVDNISAKQVTGPSAKGITIVSRKSGSTYNFTSKHASFNYNDSAYSIKVGTNAILNPTATYAEYIPTNRYLLNLCSSGGCATAVIGGSSGF